MGGIGENCPIIRSRICEGLEFLGIGLEEKQNRKNALIISKEKESVAVLVIHTDEEWMIAKTVSQVLNITKK
jgi:acetate kinase